MANTATIILVTVGAFVATDVDDMVVLAILFLGYRTSGVPRRRQIVLGQYMGFVVLVGISGSAALGLALVPLQWVGLLGVVPLSLGVRGLWSARGGGGGGDQPSLPSLRLFGGKAGPFAIAAATISTGGDNISVYSPLLRTFGWPASILAVTVLLLMLGVWCAIGAAIGTNDTVVATLSRLGHIFVPVVYICIGSLLLVDTGVLVRLVKLF